MKLKTFEQIITLTLNPTWDIHVDTRKDKQTVLRRDTGGKGINVSRALRTVGVDSTAVLLLPCDGGEKFSSRLSETLAGAIIVSTGGRVRENKHYITENGEKSESSGGGAAIRVSVEEVYSAIAPICGAGTVLLVCGSIGRGSDMAAVLEMLLRLKTLGVRLVLDSTAFTLEDISVLRPYLIKPNRDEAERLCGARIKTEADAVAVATALRDSGAERVLLSLGNDGAALATKDGVWVSAGTRVEAIGTVGAGDAALAGYVTALCYGLSEPDSLSLACAFGAAACLSEGTEPPDPCRIKELFLKIKEGR